tara:strand:- start:483 stop:746 length:264 start_codon:yes stop_codon:yes gene_type:complete
MTNKVIEMIKNQAKIEEFQIDVRTTLDPVCEYSDAYKKLQHIRSEAMKTLEATEEEVAELMELHFGNCLEIDDALIAIYPEQFGDRE